MQIQKQKKGQVTIVAILMFFLTIVVFSALLPAFNSVINNTVANITDDAEKIIVQSILFIILITIIISYLNYREPSYQQSY